MRFHLVFAFTVAVLVLPRAAVADPLYFEDFEVDHTAGWTVNDPGLSDATANFFFDYTTVGIPLAPSSAPGGVHGIQLQANLNGGVFSGLSVSPTGESFTGDYILTFDWWANFNGPFPDDGSGSTNLSTFGIGTSGTEPQWPGGTQDSLWFGATGDGGSAADWRVYSTASPAGYPDGDPVFAAATRNSSDPYYSGLGGVAAPAAQTALFPQQIGVTAVGSAGMAWHQVTIIRIGASVTWNVDGLLLSTVDVGALAFGGENIFFGHSDINATSSTDPNDVALLFTLIDNVRVEENPAAVPEPGTLFMLGAGLAAAALRKRRKA
jgi:hypothetical protein